MHMQNRQSIVHECRVRQNIDMLKALKIGHEQCKQGIENKQSIVHECRIKQNIDMLKALKAGHGQCKQGIEKIGRTQAMQRWYSPCSEGIVNGS